MDTWYLGIDLGTGSCKTALINRRGRVLALGVGEYPAVAGGRRFEEQSAAGLFAGLVDSVRAARAQAGELRGSCGGLSVGGALHSLLAVDESGEALTGVMTWADGRAAPQAARLRSAGAAHELYDQTGCPAHAMYPLYKLLWLRENEPAIFRRARRFVSAKEYVVARLTGEWRVDYNVAAGTGLLNAFSLDWHQPALELCAVDAGRLSPLGGPLARLAGLAPGAAELLGLPEGTPVFLGSSDAANSNLGAGAVQPWQATCMIGTSGAYRIIADRPALDPQRRSWCYAIDRDHWLVGGAMNNGGLALTWLRDVLGGEISFEGLLELAAQARPGAEGLVCLPLFAGERSPNWDVHARGAFVGLTSRHELRHLARAVLEGIALRMRSLQQVLADLGLEISEVRASGGFTQSPFWLQVIADVLQQDLALPAFGETSSLGAGVWALAAAGELTEPAGIGEYLPLAGVVRAQAENGPVYERLYALFERLYAAVSPEFQELGFFESR